MILAPGSILSPECLIQSVSKPKVTLNLEDILVVNLPLQTKWKNLTTLYNGTKANFTERVLKKGEVLEEKINYWRTQFAIVDSTNGYDISRKSYRTQRFTASEENSQLEVKFWSYQNGGKIGEFRVWNQATGKKLEGKSQNYKNVEHEPSEDIKKAIEQYKK